MTEQLSLHLISPGDSFPGGAVVQNPNAREGDARAYEEGLALLGGELLLSLAGLRQPETVTDRRGQLTPLPSCPALEPVIAVHL